MVAAPFSPIGSCEQPSLGAANKISSVIRILSRAGRPVVLINSAHNAKELRWTRSYRHSFGFGVSAEVIDLPTLPIRSLGKAINLTEARSVARRISESQPSLIWAYNGYAFESLLSLAVQRNSTTPLVLEIEDWPTARRRSGHPKPWIDAFLFRKMLKKASVVTFVNETVKNRVGQIWGKTLLLPGIINPSLVGPSAPRVPFSSQPYTLGYFGTLSEEKGCAVLLELIEELPPDWRLSITGAGPLLDDFLSAAETHPDRIKCTPHAPESELYDSMRNVDAIVNPHSPISQMGNGVFPFKIFEAIATDRVLISTSLPACGLDLTAAAMWFEGDVASLSQTLRRASEFYRQHNEGIRRLGESVRRLYSEDAVYDRLRILLPAVLH